MILCIFCCCLLQRLALKPTLDLSLETIFCLTTLFVLRGPVNDPTAIGEGVNNSLHCVTDYMNCCNSGSGMGNWYDTTGVEVSDQADGDSDSYVTRGDGVVYLNRRRGGQSGMWRCDIPDHSGQIQSIYIYTGTDKNGIHMCTLLMIKVACSCVKYFNTCMLHKHINIYT